MIGRRAFLHAAMAGSVFGMAGIRPAMAAPQKRVAVIDWAHLETCLALGVTPVAGSELRQYRRIVGEPKMPETVADLGLRGTPNLEMLRLVAPDLTVISQFYDYQRPVLEAISPVLSLKSYEAGTAPYGLLERSTMALGEALDARAAADGFVARVARNIGAARQALGSFAARPVYVISLGDARHFRAFGADSLMGDVLVRLGFENAWRDDTSYSAAAPIGLEALADVRDAGIVVIEPLPAEAGRGLPDNALWNALPPVKDGRVSILPPINHFGGLPSAERFAGLLADAVKGWSA
ncbi:iron-siderophore ABC transporter substrate-binding protein [Pseudohoeflea suaedae]|uniref:Iron-siderophore ABC transporter substrate-binding protein n=1 Tax=Pseudohoeflea suaedae TaxID=877384 RepID=A0A4R5PL40_9HYPH|nr:ABC transporter substrate-binding protein [Pseudohoeflea suaedae]TDH37646.1 iron-siderophore ABC transporter substrate-binding protein [Pseudohoeflea suaedae]